MVQGERAARSEQARAEVWGGTERRASMSLPLQLQPDASSAPEAAGLLARRAHFGASQQPPPGLLAAAALPEGAWELDAATATRHRQLQRSWPGRPLLRPGSSGSGSTWRVPQFASMGGSVLGAGGKKFSADGLQAVPAAVMEGAVTAAGLRGARAFHSLLPAAFLQLHSCQMLNAAPRAHCPCRREPEAVRLGPAAAAAAGARAGGLGAGGGGGAHFAGAAAQDGARPAGSLLP